MAEDLLSFSGVRFGYDSAPVLTEITFQAPATGVTALAGPSGSGKSTLLRLANRLLAAQRGTISYRGADVTTIDPPALRRRLGMVFQRAAAFAGSVRDNLAVASPELTDQQADALLSRVGLDPALSRREASELSGGELQRMCLARALATGPEALLLDEPTAALDPGARQGLERLARELADSGMPLLWVTHDIAQLRRVADHVVLLLHGGVRLSGTVADLDAAAHADPEIAGFLAETPSEVPADER